MIRKAPSDSTPSDIATEATSFSNPALIEWLRSDKIFQKEGKIARTVVRSQDLTIVITLLKQGNSLHEHKAPGPINVTVLQGELEFQVNNDDRVNLKALDTIAVPAGTLHAVQALTDSAFMITIGGKH